MTSRKRAHGTGAGALRRLAPALVGAAALAGALLAAVPARSGEAAGKGPSPPAGGIVLWAPCTREQAERWASDARNDGTAALRAAGCYAAIIESGGEKSSGVEDARRGRAAAEAAVARLPRSGVAHYLAAYLAGLAAERQPLRGLSLVPIIEREARLAADLDPAVDRGGPDRMLGELYLRAPGSPVSVGNIGKAVLHYRRAAAVDPSAPENRLGLAESLLAAHEADEACDVLRALLAEMPPGLAEKPARAKASELADRACSRGGER